MANTPNNKNTFRVTVNHDLERLSKADLGKKRANPNQNLDNMCNFVECECERTPTCKDVITIPDNTGFPEIRGIISDGCPESRFFQTNNKLSQGAYTMRENTSIVPTANNLSEVERLIARSVNCFEVNSVVTVEIDGTDLVICHYGATTIQLTGSDGSVLGSQTRLCTLTTVCDYRLLQPAPITATTQIELLDADGAQIGTDNLPNTYTNAADEAQLVSDLVTALGNAGLTVTASQVTATFNNTFNAFDIEVAEVAQGTRIRIGGVGGNEFVECDCEEDFTA